MRLLFAIEREINGLAPQQRVTRRSERSQPLVIDLESWLRGQRARVSKNSETGRAIDYSLKCWPELTRFLEDGRLCMSNNAAERELRAVAVGRRWLCITQRSLSLAFTYLHMSEVGRGQFPNLIGASSRASWRSVVTSCFLIAGLRRDYHAIVWSAGGVAPDPTA